MDEDIKAAVTAISQITKSKGVLWEQISTFVDTLETIDSVAMHHTPEMDQLCPVKHHIENGLYTREVFMPKGALVVSFIHKQTHPSFFLKGEMSILDDSGNISTIKAPMSLMTEIGTQRVAVMHEDCIWTCVYKTDKKTVEEAEKDVYTLDFRTLPSSILLNKKMLCQEY